MPTLSAHEISLHLHKNLQASALEAWKNRASHLNSTQPRIAIAEDAYARNNAAAEF